MGDADITLRHISRRHAEALARPYVTGGPLEIVGWADTQATAIERRLDKTLLLRVDHELHALEIEFEYRYERDLPERVHIYQALSRMAFQAERPAERPPPMETVVILLTGRRQPWRVERSLRTGWRRRRFSGTRFRLDAVYQRTVAELFARGSPFWLTFTPLARDADVRAMRAVVSTIRSSVPNATDRTELFTALLVMADVDPWEHTLRPEIEAMLLDEPTDLIDVSKTLRDAYEKGQRAGIEQGIEKMLRGLFAKRLHRALTATEKEALAERAAQDPERIQDTALTLEGDALSAWLLATDTPGRARRTMKKSRTQRAKSAQAPRAAQSKTR